MQAGKATWWLFEIHSQVVAKAFLSNIDLNYSQVVAEALLM